MVNALRHSNASRIEVEVGYQSPQLQVVVRDNGRGIDAELIQLGRRSHWGLSGMRERARSIAAHFEIRTSPGAGAEVEISVPGATCQF